MPAPSSGMPAPRTVRYGEASFRQALDSIEAAAASGERKRVALVGATPEACKDLLVTLVKAAPLNAHQYGMPNLLSDRYVETHGNLREAFDTADEEAALLYFDGGDVLFAPEQLDEVHKERVDELFPADYFFERVTAFEGVLLFCLRERRHVHHLPLAAFDVLIEF